MEKFDKTREATPKVKRAETRIPDELLEKEKLSLYAKVILAKVLGLWKNCNKEVFISNERLSKLLGGVTIRTVQRAKKELTDLKLIKVDQEEKGKGFKVTPFLQKGVQGELKGVQGETLKGFMVNYHTSTIHQIYTWEGWR